MLRHNWFIWALAWAGLSCNNATLKKAPLIGAGSFVEDAAASNENTDTHGTDNGSIAQTPATPMPAESKAPEEKVNPPANISGSYLICAETKPATDLLPESTINCAVRDEKTNNKLNLDTSYASKVWSYEGSGSSGMQVMMADLPSSLEWHIAVTLKGSTMLEVQGLRDSIKFYISVVNSAGVKFQNWAVVSPMFTQWLSLDGAKVPVGAAIGGTEDDGKGTLYICRLYAGAEVIPGKMIIHYNNSNKSMCYATANGQALESQSDDGNTMLYKSDVLKIVDGVFDDYYEWVPASNGLKPAQAVITGVDALGNPLYSCRNLQNDGSFAEQTPGVLRPGASTCTHEFYGVKSNTNYQVLSWKASGTAKIIATRPAAP